MKRTPMSRGNGFKRPVLERKPPSRPMPIARGVVVLCNEMAVASPKGEKARPGKRAPTVAERAWMDFIVAYGCIACRLEGKSPRPTAVHHILRGGVRMGHMHTLPLCDPGHHQGGQPFGMVSRHPDKAQFEAAYGTEQHLLQILRNVYTAQSTRAPAAINIGATP